MVTAYRPDLPTGTVTFLFTDIEGSTRLTTELDPAVYRELLERHNALLRDAFARHGGVERGTQGDSFFVVFVDASAAVRAAIDAQRALAAAAWPAGGSVRVRMGLHTGMAIAGGDDYVGIDVNRAARIAASAHGGQILLSDAARILVERSLPGGVSLRDLGDHHLKDLVRPERLHQVVGSDLPADFPPPRTLDTPAGDLPARLTTFIGRAGELDALMTLLTHQRLVTLTGPGGIGKTSLAVEAAKRLAAGHPDGAWFVRLDEVRDPTDVRAAIARGIGIFDGPERSADEALASYVADRSMLVLLDSMEHLLPAAAEVAGLVRSSPRSRVIVTSRAPLRIAGEQEVPVLPLVADAAGLFIDRARSVRPGWDPGSERPLIDELCKLLDYLPLGIELAAARVATLPLTVIRDRLAARLPLPASGPRDAPARQRTLDAAVAWSHDLLTTEQRALLHALGVFEDGFDLEQVGFVAHGSDRDNHLGDLLELADHSLVVAAPTTTGRARFRLLRTIQSFALERLVASGRAAEVHRLHAEAFHALAAEGASHLGTSRHAASLERVEPEIANLRAAIGWAIDADQGDLALRLTGVSWRFWHSFGLLNEGRRLTAEALASPAAQAVSSARAWASAAAGNLAYWQGDHAAAREYYEAQRSLALDAGDDACLADASFNLIHFGVVDLAHVGVVDLDDTDAQIAYIDSLVDRFRAIGDERGAARADWFRGTLLAATGRVDEAISRMLEELESFERLDDAQYHAMTAAGLGWTKFVRGDHEDAVHWSVRALVEAHAMRDVATATITLSIGVLIGVMRGRYEDGAIINGAFDSLCDRYGVRPPVPLSEIIGVVDPISATREALDPETFAAAYARGRSLSLDEAVALVVELADQERSLE